MADRRRGAAHAYDVSIADPRDEQIGYSTPSHSSAGITHSVRRDEAQGTYLKIMVVVALSFLMLYAVVDSKLQAKQIRDQINEEQRVVDVLRSEKIRMQTEIESKSSMRSVEDYAENILGMQKLEKSQCEYVSLESGNVIEIPENNDNIFVKIKTAFSEFLDYIRG
jgi:cell division protein FtsL